MSDTVSGVDASSSCTPDTITCLQNAGIAFVGRYYSRTTQIPGKKLTADEAVLISSGGMKIVAVYEDGPTEYSYFSATRGNEDATTAMQQAAAVGQPHGSAIYFTVDYNATDSDIAANITAYFQAVNQVLDGYYIIGVYGSGAVCSAMLNAGLAARAWLCQSTAWSGYSDFTDWVIKQGPEQAVCGLNSDTDVAQGHYGGFVVHATPAAG